MCEAVSYDSYSDNEKTILCFANHALEQSPRKIEHVSHSFCTGRIDPKTKPSQHVQCMRFD